MLASSVTNMCKIICINKLTCVERLHHEVEFGSAELHFLTRVYSLFWLVHL
jgi:hypothetical protein